MDKSCVTILTLDPILGSNFFDIVQSADYSQSISLRPVRMFLEAEFQDGLSFCGLINGFTIRIFPFQATVNLN